MSNLKRMGRTWLGRELEYFGQSHVGREHGARCEESCWTAAGLVVRGMRNGLDKDNGARSQRVSRFKHSRWLDQSLFLILSSWMGSCPIKEVFPDHYSGSRAPYKRRKEGMFWTGRKGESMCYLCCRPRFLCSFWADILADCLNNRYPVLKMELLNV